MVDPVIFTSQLPPLSKILSSGYLSVMSAVPPISQPSAVVLPSSAVSAGSPVSEAILEYSTRVGIVLIVSLMVFAFANDIARFI